MRLRKYFDLNCSVKTVCWIENSVIQKKNRKQKNYQFSWRKNTKQLNYQIFDNKKTCTNVLLNEYIQQQHNIVYDSQIYQIIKY